MGELSRWLALLPKPRLERLAANVLEVRPPSRALVEKALVRKLSDREWVQDSLEQLGPAAKAAARALVDAGVPVRRADLASLASDPDGDPIEALEDHGFVAAVKTGPGMPTHVALAPGLEKLLAFETTPRADGAHLAGAALGGALRRFRLALTIGLLFQHPPRLNRDGHVHSTDLAALASRLKPLGVTSRQLARELAALTDVGALSARHGRLVPVAERSLDVSEQYLRLALKELASPALSDEAAAAVAGLLSSGGSLSLAQLLESAQSALLRERATNEEKPARGARGEIVRALSALLSLEALVLLDSQGHPVVASGEENLARGRSLLVALEPTVAAMLTGAEAEATTFRPALVQSSFEVVADASADPSLVAAVAAFSRLVRADFAAVMRIERQSVERALEAGVSPLLPTNALEALSGRPLPQNVATTLSDWLQNAPSGKSTDAASQTPLADLCNAARARLSAFDGD